MQKTLYSFPNINQIIEESVQIALEKDTDSYETEVFYHERTKATFRYMDYPPGTHCCDDDPVIDIYGSKRAVKRLEMLLTGKKTLIDRVLVLLNF